MKKGLFLSLVFCVLVGVTGGAKPKQWTTQFTYRNYDCLPETHVKRITVTRLNQKKAVTGTEVFEFDPDGCLMREYAIHGSDTTDIITYKYRGGRLVDIESSLFSQCHLKYDGNGFLTEIRYFEDWQGKRTLSKTCWLKYNEDGLMSSCIIVKEGIGYAPDSDVEDMGWNQDILISYHEGLRSSYEQIIRDLNTSESRREVYSYQENGFAKDLTITDLNSGKTLQAIRFSYKFDDEGNWIERTGTVNGRFQGAENRQFQYYTESELALFAESEAKDDGGFFGWLKDYFDGVGMRLRMQSLEYGGGIVLLVIVLILTLAGMIVALLWMIGKPVFKRKVMSNGMSRLWMYDSSRYLNVLTYFGIALGCFIAAILVIALVGGIAWLLAWIIKIIFTLIIWIGAIMTVVGIIGALGKNEAAALLIPGLIILCFERTLERWGDSIVDWSFGFLRRVNMIGWGFHFITNLWDVILLVFLAPIAVFLLFALVIILVNSLLNGFEWIMTRIYSIRRPCPCCGSTQTPDYIVNGKVHPVKLHPGTYGILTQRLPGTGKKIPTMLLNGKGKLTRKCPQCGTIINADAERSFGTDIHIGFVGHPASGKTYLLYSGLGYLLKAYPKDIKQVDADPDTLISEKLRRIASGAGIHTNRANRYRAVQLMVSSKKRPVPYHLFFYDVAGEKFDAASLSYKTAMDFYKNVQTVVFVIDPGMIDYSGTSACQEIKDWANRNGAYHAYRIEDALSVLKQILETVGRDSRIIDFTFVFTKADTGYFEAAGANREGMSEKQLERFLRGSLGLANLVNLAKASFKSVHFFEISVTDGNTARLGVFFHFLLKQRGVSIG